MELKSSPEEKMVQPSCERRSTVVEMLNDFCKETSLHGVKFLLQGCVSTPRRLLWIAVVVAQLVGFLIVIIGQLVHVYSRPTLTKISVSYVREMPFPAVTICGQIPNWTHDSMSDFDNNVMQNVYAGNKTFFTSLPPAEYENISLANIYKNRLQIEGMMMVRFCLFASRRCNKHVGETITTEGLCNTINSVISHDLQSPRGNKSHVKGNKVPPLVSRVPGVSSGLHLVLKLNSFQDTGLKITLHEPDEKVARTNSEFLQLAPGSTNHIRLRVRQNKFLAAPYRAFGDRACMEITKDFSHPLVTQGRYTLRACLDACVAVASRDFCGCEVALNSDEICDPIQMIDCLYKLQNALTNDSLAETLCDCPIPCKDVVYETTLSSTPLIDEGDKSIKRNAMEISISFDRLSIELTEQVPDYTIGDVVATVGGQMGLFLGASVITLVEIIELLVRCAHRWILGRSRAVSMI